MLPNSHSHPGDFLRIPHNEVHYFGGGEQAQSPAKRQEQRQVKRKKLERKNAVFYSCFRPRDICPRVSSCTSGHGGSQDSCTFSRSKNSCAAHP
mmetsp:Transcript_3212/g.7480  ORF Transcript_3212/g.7480 Transcript_3212/m.7480 type:complete len:94 (+) Transcript_3212:595-876(+)